MKVPTEYRETENYHRFEVRGKAMNGRIYIPKTAPVPPELTLELTPPSSRGQNPQIPPLKTSEEFPIENRDQAQAMATFLWIGEASWQKLEIVFTQIQMR